MSPRLRNGEVDVADVWQRRQLTVAVKRVEIRVEWYRYGMVEDEALVACRVVHCNERRVERGDGKPLVVVAWSQILGGGGGEEVIDEVKGVSHASHEVEAAEERALSLIHI